MPDTRRLLLERAPRQTERGGLVVRERHRARAAERRGGGVPGARRHAAVAAVAAPRDRRAGGDRARLPRGASRRLPMPGRGRFGTTRRADAGA